MQLNYHHLYYFYVIAREGGINKASEVLNLTPQTISAQLGTFEEYLGMKLFERSGRRLVLNENGHFVLGYAQDIFGLGDELIHNLDKQEPGQHRSFIIGVTDVIPKVLAFDLFRSCLDSSSQLKLICREGEFEELLGELAIGKLDVLFSDRPVNPGVNLKAYNHKLGDSGFTFFASEPLFSQLSGEFPICLHQAPFLISGDRSTQKLSLFAWFEREGVRPNVVAEYEDSALMKLFGQSAYGVFCVPSIIEAHVQEQYDVKIIGRTDQVKESFYLISPERKIKHPATKPLFEFAQGFMKDALY